MQRVAIVLEKVLNVICDMTENSVSLEAKLSLLHIYPANFVNASLQILVLVLAKSAWKCNQSFEEMSCNLALEKLTHICILRGKVYVFNDLDSIYTFYNAMNYKQIMWNINVDYKQIPDVIRILLQ